MRYLDAVFLRHALPEDSYLAQISAVACLQERKLVLDRDVTFLVGENGSGKSTLLKNIYKVDRGSLRFQCRGWHPEFQLFHPRHPLRIGQAADCVQAALPQRRLFSAGGELLQRGHTHRTAG